MIATGAVRTGMASRAALQHVQTVQSRRRTEFGIECDWRAPVLRSLLVHQTKCCHPFCVVARCGSSWSVR